MNENKNDLLQQSKDVIVKLVSALEEANKKVDELLPYKATVERITNKDEWFDGKEIAKLLNFKGYGRNTIYALLRDKNIFDGSNQPYQKFVDAGYFKLIIKENENNCMVHNVPLVSAKGINYVRRIIDEHINNDTNEL